MLTYSQSLRELYNLERLGMKFGLEGISALLHHLSDPHKKFRSIHVAGTNGKGSTASMLAAICTSAGYKTGLYTSPHLIRFEERIRIDGKPITRTAVSAITSRLLPRLRRNSPTFFEATTAMAFRYFADENVDIAIVETGLGGRLDSTNVLTPLVSLITNIGLEHTELLGDSLGAIAKEKAGVIKRGRRCITGIRQQEAIKVVKQVAKTLGAPITVATGFSVKIRKASIESTLLDFSSHDSVYKNLKLSLAGDFQIDNLAVVLASVSAINKEGALTLDEQAVRTGLAGVQELTGLNGRMSVVHRHPRVIADVAHNPDATRNIADSLKKLGTRISVIVFGVLRDKDYISMVRTLGAVSSHVVAVAPRSERARSASDVAAAFEREGNIVRAALSVAEGMKIAVGLARDRGTILLTGSHFVVGEGMAALRQKNGA